MKTKCIISILLIICLHPLQAQTPNSLSAINVFTYNSKGNVIEKDYYPINNGQQEDPDKTYTLYDNNDKVKLQFTINNFGDTIQKSTYDYQGYIIIVTDYTYYASNMVPVNKTMYYGVKETQKGMIDILSLMFPGPIPLYICDSFQIDTWTSNAWGQYMKGYYTFNEQDNPSNVLANVSMGQSNFDLQFTFTYDNTYNCTNISTFFVYQSVPLSLMKTDIQYNANNKPTEVHIYPDINPLLKTVIGDSFDDFLVEQKILYTYNSRNDILNIKYLSYDTTSLTFYETGVSRYTYKSMIVNSTEIYVVDTIFEFTNALTDIKSNSPCVEHINIYPNPVKETINIQGITSGSTLMIYDMKGIAISRQLLDKDNISIPVQELAKGLYVLKISHEEGVFVTKFIKE